MTHDPRTSFLTQLLTTPAGRQHMLSISVDAEEGDETGIFDRLADVVDDPKLVRIVERHRDDEVRHAALFRGCLDRLGLEKQEIPAELKIIHQIGEARGGAERAIETPDDVVAVYAMLLAIEDRGVEQFPAIAEAFRPHDPDTADTYLRVARDERGHVRYCETVGRHYAGDDETWRAAVATARAVEAEAFVGVGLANVGYCADRGWVSADVLTA